MRSIFSVDDVSRRATSRRSRRLLGRLAVPSDDVALLHVVIVDRRRALVPEAISTKE